METSTALAIGALRSEEEICFVVFVNHAVRGERGRGFPVQFERLQRELDAMVSRVFRGVSAVGRRGGGFLECIQRR